MDKFPMSAEARDSDYHVAIGELILTAGMLNNAGYPFEELPEDVVTIYYADFIRQELVDAGVKHFRKNHMPMHTDAEQGALAALERIGAMRHREFFADAILGAPRGLFGYGISASKADGMLAEAGRSENVAALIYELLRASEQIEWMEGDESDMKVAELMLDRMTSAHEEKED
ncbi:MAG: hypothetical protein CL535_19945 [Ahrensia sp.]|nr:hypothetical protein [Ahrensia sp.]|tara:strand:+ start:14087 stop:14605 length:519 start_codon:yes stop_codon:yes gene_type:complete